LCILPRKINRIRANKKINLYLRNNNFQISTTLEVWICFFVILPAMDLRDQLKNLFPQHQPSNESEEVEQHNHELFIQKEPMICKYEKRKGKATTIIEGYEGSDEDFKVLAKELKTKLSVGGTFKDSAIIIQGDYRDKIMNLLKDKGFKVKRVGG
jgi:translation initiation factor 1